MLEVIAITENEMQQMENEMESATMQFYGLYLLSVISTKLQVQYLELQVTFMAGHPKVIDSSGCHRFAGALDPILKA